MAVAQFSGLASGIDSAALIDAIIEARSIKNELRQKDIDFLNSENDALEELNTKLLALEELIDPFRTANGGGVDRKAASSDPTIATSLVNANAVNSSYSLTVTSVAQTATGSLYNSTPYTSGSDVFQSGGGGGNVEIKVGTGSDQVTITVNVTLGSTTVNEVVDAINSDANAEGRVSASLVNTGTTASPSYQIVLNTLEQGTEKGTLEVNLTSLANVSVSTIDQALDAVFSIDGINGTITRDSNSIDDVLPGTTLQLLKAGSTTLTVSSDQDSTADAMESIIEAFNEIVEYINENDTITPVENDKDNSNVYGTLAKTRIDNDFLGIFRSNISTASSTSGSSVFSFADLGISTNRDGTISFDSDKFKEAAAEDPDGTTEVLRDFADLTAGYTGSIYQYTKLGGFIDIGQQGNDNEIETLNEAIAALDRQNEKIRESYQKRFSNLETTIAKLQSDQSQLASALASLGQ